MTANPTKLAMIDKVIGSINFLIDHPEAQVRRRLATDKAGREVPPTDPEAVCWCALGRVAHDIGLAVPRQSSGDRMYDNAVAISDTYAAIIKPLLSLGLSKHMFITANDAYRSPAERQAGLIRLRNRLLHHRGAFL